MYIWRERERESERRRYYIGGGQRKGRFEGRECSVLCAKTRNTKLEELWNKLETTLSKTRVPEYNTLEQICCCYSS